MTYDKKLLSENNHECPICGNLQSNHTFQQQQNCQERIRSKISQRCIQCHEFFSATKKTHFCSLECRAAASELIRRARAGHNFDRFN